MNARLVRSALMAWSLFVIPAACGAEPDYEQVIQSWLNCTECDASTLDLARKMSKAFPEKLRKVLASELSEDALHSFDVMAVAKRLCSGERFEAEKTAATAFRLSLIERWEAITRSRRGAPPKLTCENFVASYLGADRDSRIVRAARIVEGLKDDGALNVLGETIKRYQGTTKPSQFVLDAYEEAISPDRSPP